MKLLKRLAIWLAPREGDKLKRMVRRLRLKKKGVVDYEHRKNN